MKFLSLTAAAFIMSCGFANAQATNLSRTPGDAMSRGNSDMRDYRSDRRRAMRQNRRHYRGYAYRSGRGYAYRPSYNAYGYNPHWSGVQVGPFGFGVWNNGWRY
jgi:hypothetical protein